MQQHQFEMDRALEALRDDRPSPASVELAYSSLEKRGSRSYAGRLIAVAVATLLAAIVLYPRGKSGVAWSQVVEKTLSAPIVHRVGYRGAIKSDEQWTSARGSVSIGFEDGQAEFVAGHIDGKMFQLLVRGPTPTPDRPNAREYAIVHSSLTSKRKGYPIGSIERLLAAGNVRLVAHIPPADADSLEMYRIEESSSSLPNSETSNVFVDAKTHLIRKITDREGHSDFDYPHSVPSGTFSLDTYLPKGVVAYDPWIDQKRWNDMTTRNLQRGIAREASIALQFVGLNRTGDLWVLWSGYTPSQLLRPSFRLPGIQCKNPATYPVFTAHPERDRFRLPTTAVKPPPVGACLTPQKVLSDFVDLDIPNGRGYTRFNHVPILRFRDMNDFAGVLFHIRHPRKNGNTR